MRFEKLMVIGKDADLMDTAREIAQVVYWAEDIKEAGSILNSTVVDDVLLGGESIDEQTAKWLSDKGVKKLNFWGGTGGCQGVRDITGGLCGGVSGERRVGNLTFTTYDLRFDKSGTVESWETGEAKSAAVKIQNEDPAKVAGVIISGMKGASAATRRMAELIKIVAKSNCNPVLIVGETGTGKEVAARAVHDIRHGSDAAFVGINCAALTTTLLESELFGHVKGSFTGADKDKTGLLEIAEGGSVFLDEISEMNLELQAKLLRVLQEKTFRKVGGTKEIVCKATIIASSNRKLLAEAGAGRFRQDLYYRLAVFPIQLLPLRAKDRVEDVCELAGHFLATSNICPQKSGKIAGFTKLALEALERYEWPGNVRELKNVIERAILLENTDKIGLSSLVFNPEAMGEEKQSACAISVSNDFSLERAEKELISKALAESNWQKTRAAAMLGITRATLYAKVKQYDIRGPESLVTESVEEVQSSKF
ncbi:MAG: hypothetical protein A2Y07_09320 [Planctomycetes bacterium GWF2_50_10]|nr:MAG: hypothetical protein A2Y07_09320 [Planctomycetes bacterium GWF2_50_10]